MHATPVSLVATPSAFEHLAALANLASVTRFPALPAHVAQNVPATILTNQVGKEVSTFHWL